MKYFLKRLIILSVFAIGANSSADHLDPIASTNKNEQTSLFKDSVEDVGGFENQINGGKDSALHRMSDSAVILEDITGKKEAKMRQATGNLERIRANDLESAGVKEIQEKKVMEALYINETEDLWQEHKKDANLIANASSALLSKLMDKLKEIGVDCRQVKGSKVIEPEYYIDIKKEASQDAKYESNLCEELRNKYNCRDEVTLTCTERGIRWDPWENKTIEIDGPEIFYNRLHWMHSYRWRNKHFGHHLRTDPGIITEIRHFIAHRTNTHVDSISTTLEVINRPFSIYEHIIHVARKSYVWPSYRVNYQYRKGHEICVQWKEDWIERCVLR